MTAIDEHVIFSLLKKQGFSLAEKKEVTKQEDLVKILKKITYPILLKVQSEEIVQKQHATLVSGALSDEKQVLVEYERMKELLKKKYMHVRSPIFVLQPFLSGKECTLQSKKHPSFGYVLSFSSDVWQMRCIAPYTEVIVSSLPLVFEKQKQVIADFLQQLSLFVKNSSYESFTLQCIVSATAVTIFQAGAVE